MHQKRLKSGATIADISASTYNEMVAKAQLQLGQSSLYRTTGKHYVSVVGRNQCGYTVEPGAPVLLGAWTGETTGYGSGGMGWLNVHPCYFPVNSTETAELASLLFNVGICVGDSVAANALGDFAIYGLVEIKCGTGLGFVGPQPKSAAYQTTGRVHSSFGFAKKLYDVGGGYAVCDLCCKSSIVQYELTQARQAPPSYTTANVAGIPSIVLDSHLCAAWQANGDKGMAMLVDKQFLITTPWCVDA